MSDARYEAVKLLSKTFKNNGYSNILLDSALSASDMDEREKRLCTALYYGVLERKITLDHIISGYCRISKTNPHILNILRVGIYQLLYMDQIPDSAAVSQCVDIAKKMGMKGLSGFVNGVLRRFIRDGKTVNYPDDHMKRLSVEYSAPLWLVDMLYSNYGSVGLTLINSSLGTPPVTVRLNTAVYSREEILGTLEYAEPVQIPDCPDCCKIKSGDITGTKAYIKGMVHVQDIASQLCCMALAPGESDTVLDLCAAPGGKTFTIAELMNGKGKVYAFDLHEKRVGLIRSGAERLHLENIIARQGNATVFDPDIPLADKILCDVPCSGIGVIRRKPEIKYKSPDFDRLPCIQYNILENAAKYLKPEGEIVYSTCTVNPAENEEVVEKFLRNHPEFEGIAFLEKYGAPFGAYKVTLFPEYFDSDGFFICKMRRKKV